jgi:hypothetical protein
MFCVRVIAAAGLPLLLAGCVSSGEAIRFQAKGQQEVILRDGEPMVMSRGRASLVTIKPATRQVGVRPVFVVGIQNLSQQPLTFRVAEVRARQVASGQVVKDLKVYTYDELLREEQNAQIARAVLVGVVGGVNSGLAARRGGYAQYRADVQNEQMATNVAIQGQQNLAALEQLAIKDHTLLPGEQYAGKLAMEGPSSDDATEQKTYSLAFALGPDRHEIQVVQGVPPK